MRSAVVLVLEVVVGIVALVNPCPAHADGDPSALWHIVSDQCEPNQVANRDPAPCAMVDPVGGYAVLKDLVGPTQFLLIPTRRSSGIDDPAILEPSAPNYFADAWRARSFVDARAGAQLPREWIGLAMNSAFARSQDQLHIHDCVRPGARADMAARTLVVVGSVNAAGGPGFVLLSDHADAATGDEAEGEQLQDHDFCPRLAASAPGK